MRILLVLLLLVISTMLIAKDGDFYIVADETCVTEECRSYCDFDDLETALRLLDSEDIIRMYPKGGEVCVGTLTGEPPPGFKFWWAMRKLFNHDCYEQ